MRKRISKSAQRIADNWNQYILDHREKTKRRAMAMRSKRYAKDATSRRRAKFYAKREGDHGEKTT
jgi:hypothetical protein